MFCQTSPVFILALFSLTCVSLVANASSKETNIDEKFSERLQNALNNIPIEQWPAYFQTFTKEDKCEN
jgi:hypothetical protein